VKRHSQLDWEYHEVEDQLTKEMIAP